MVARTMVRIKIIRPRDYTDYQFGVKLVTPSFDGFWRTYEVFMDHEVYLAMKSPDHVSGTIHDHLRLAKIERIEDLEMIDFRRDPNRYGWVAFMGEPKHVDVHSS
jgi:hypothetical protein